LTIVYGTDRRARAEIRRLNQLHRSVVGPVHDQAAARLLGDSYAARDPELSLWVHATLVDSTLVAQERWIGPIGAARRAAFYEETRPIGRAFGVPQSLLPADIDAFDAYLARMTGRDGPIRVGALARELARTILRPPLGPLHPALAGIPPALYAWTLWPAIELLPEPIRIGYDLPWGLRQRVVSAWLTRAWRAWRPILPVAMRTMPLALAADARLADR
ncbi:MAG: oxygenase MpaB family protein, partial [Candidatus Limnocylindrales bacterium]